MHVKQNRIFERELDGIYLFNKIELLTLTIQNGNEKTITIVNLSWSCCDISLNIQTSRWFDYKQVKLMKTIGKGTYRLMLMRLITYIISKKTDYCFSHKWVISWDLWQIPIWDNCKKYF